MASMIMLIPWEVWKERNARVFCHHILLWRRPFAKLKRRHVCGA
jgi:hypothetical protein